MHHFQYCPSEEEEEEQEEAFFVLKRFRDSPLTSQVTRRIYDSKTFCSLHKSL